MADDPLRTAAVRNCTRPAADSSWNVPGWVLCLLGAVGGAGLALATRFHLLFGEDFLRRLYIDQKPAIVLPMRLDRDNVVRLIRWIAAIDCYALTFSSLDAAADLVAQAAPQVS